MVVSCRFAFSVVWEITPQAEIVSSKYHKSIIKSKVKRVFFVNLQIDVPFDGRPQIPRSIGFGIWRVEALTSLCFQAALTYAEAQARIDDKSMNDSLTLGLRRLNKLAKILKKKRIDNG